MTPERKRALQWFHDRGEVRLKTGQEGQPTGRMIALLVDLGQLEVERPRYGMGSPIFRLTDKGRRRLHGDDA